MAQQESARFIYELALPSGTVTLACTLLISGFYPVPSAIRYDHPHPPFNRLFYFLKGGCVVNTLEHSFTLRSGMPYLLPADQSFSVTYRGCSRFIYTHFLCTATNCWDVFRGTRGVLPLPSGRALGKELAYWYGREGYAALLRWHSAVWQTVAAWVAAHAPAIPSTCRIPVRYQEMMAFLRAHLHPNLRLSELARRQHCTVSALAKGFRRAYGISLKSFLMQELMREARNLLTTTDLPVFQVAYKLGYEDPFYFQRVFKKQTDLTPLQYRQTCQKWQQDAEQTNPVQ